MSLQADTRTSSDPGFVPLPCCCLHVCYCCTVLGGKVERAAESVEDSGQDVQSQAQQNQGKQQIRDEAAHKV